MKLSGLKKVNHIYFIGIGGISMSALAMLCYKNGCVVAGSDASKNAETIKLAEYFKKYKIGVKDQ